MILKPSQGETAQELIDRLKNSGDEWPTTFRANFIEPGLVYYQDLDMTLLVRRPALDQMRASFRGRPVVNEAHRDVTGKAFKATDPLEQADGIVVEAWNDASDGWDHAAFIVWDELTKRNCMNGYSVSCAYRVTNIDATPGIHHNIPYDGELISGEYTHLAIVRNPRYEGAKILANSEGGIMKIFKWFQKDKKVEIKSADGLLVDVKGTQVPLTALIEAHNSIEAKKAAVTPPAAKPAAEPVLVNADETVEVDGSPLKVSDLVNEYEAEEKEKKEKAEKDAKDAEDRKNAEEAEAKEKEKKDLEDKERKNALTEEERKKFEELKNAANLRGQATAPKLFTREEQLAAGTKFFGSDPKK